MLRELLEAIDVTSAVLVSMSNRAKIVIDCSATDLVHAGHPALLEFFPPPIPTSLSNACTALCRPFDAPAFPSG